MVSALCALLSLVATGSGFHYNNTTASFNKWRETYGVEYDGLAETAHRFASWSENLIKVAAHNARADQGQVTFRLAMNRFADLSNQE